MGETLREKRQRAGRAGGQATAARLSASGAGPVSGPGAPFPALGPDGLVYGTADELRALAEAMDDTGPKAATARSRAVAASQRRIDRFRADHPSADLDRLVHRPFCETSVSPVDQRPVRVRAAAPDDDRAQMWIDDVIMWPNPWGEGISARAVREALDELDGADVTVHMNSPGGDVFEGIAIYQMFIDYPGDLYVAVDALAASIASVIAMGGDLVGVGNLAMMMIHEASGFAYGNAADMLQMAMLLDQVSGTIAISYATKVDDPGKDVAYFRDLMKAETWMDAARSLDEGLADERLNPAEDDSDEDAASAVASWRPAAIAGSFAALGDTRQPPALSTIVGSFKEAAAS